MRRQVAWIRIRKRFQHGLQEGRAVHHGNICRRPGDVLDGLLPARLDFDRDLVAHLLRSAARYVDAAGVRQRLDPGGDIHPVTIDVVALTSSRH